MTTSSANNSVFRPVSPAPIPPEGQQVAPEILGAHAAWIKGSKEIAGLMLMTMKPEIQRNLENLHAHKMLKELKTPVAQQAGQELCNAPLRKEDMTTSVVNNSFFKGFFEKQKLIGPNFIDWYRQLRIVLLVEDKLNYLEHPIHAALVPAQAGQQVAPEAHATWVKGSKEIVGLMLMTRESDI
nr:hypothetical protein [Tanacetum cinerariifolium]